MSIFVAQAACILFATVSIGQSIKSTSTKFDKILYGVFCLIFLILFLCMQEVS